MGEIVDLPIEVPFTEGMRRAIRECRFKTTNQARTFAWVLDSDRARMEATGMEFAAFRPAPDSDPSRWDHEARSADSRVVEFVASLAQAGNR